MFAVGVAALVAALAAQHDPSAIVSIHVGADRTYTREHTIIISSAEQYLRSEAQRDGVLLTAIREWDGGHQTMTSDECPAIREVVASLDRLPHIPIVPPARYVWPSVVLTPPTIKDGFSTRLSLRTLNSDGSFSDITISSGTAYQTWGNEAVAALIDCWGPLTP